MFKLVRKIKNRGQTTLEYALVIGVIVVGAIMMGRSFFGENGTAQGIFQKAVDSSMETMGDQE